MHHLSLPGLIDEDVKRMEGLPIKTAARSCVALFTARLDEQTLFPAKDQFDEELDCLETQSARFNLWADNIGALAEGHASLDYRLHEYPDLENLVRDQLSAIQKHLKRCKSSKTPCPTKNANKKTSI